MNLILKNKLALVTGANRGIGLSVIKKFSENGANIIACARKKNQQFEQEIINISKKFNNQINIVYFDLSKGDEIVEGIKEIYNISNNIEILVNNAGINQVSLFQMTPLQKMRDIFEINFFSHLMLTQKIMKLMIKNKKGTIINIASNAAIECDLGRSGYASSKAALIAFTKVLSKELGSFNIRVNAVAPGITKTEMMNQDISKKIMDEAIKRVPLKRAAEPEEISDVIMFLASDMSRYVNGEVIFVTGGY